MSVGIYIHIPFCQSRCNYCHFITRPWEAATADRYRHAVVAELRHHFAAHPLSDRVDTIYFGGGTPSIVPPAHIAAMLEACRALCSVSADCEITLEANPGTLTPEKVLEYQRIGVNRISMGAQSFSGQELDAIGRAHTVADIAGSVSLLRDAGISNLNLDLILGLPDQTHDRWLDNVRSMVEVGPPHVSIYMLDLDDKSPLYHSIAKGLHRLPDEDAVSEWYLETLDHFRASGYEQYEISNFARPGFRSRHNLKYWQRRPVLGFGVGSHSYDGSARYANLPSVAAYLETVEAGKSPVEWRRPVGVDQALEETFFLGLRLTEGLDWSRMLRDFPRQRLAGYECSLREMTDSGLLEWDDAVVRLTPAGMLLSNEVFQQFITE